MKGRGQSETSRRPYIGQKRLSGAAAAVLLGTVAFFTGHFRLGGSAHGTAPPGHYDLSTPGVVRDTGTGLEWEQAPPYSLSPGSVDNARAYCAALQLNGGGWRLPTPGELVTLVDPDADQQKLQPTIDSVAFPAPHLPRDWTDTPVAGDPKSGWLIEFEVGSTDPAPYGGNAAARCVR